VLIRVIRGNSTQKMIQHTKGIVLRTVKYGETSLVVTVLTELFGIQSYMVNGVRTNSKKGAGRANLFQPISILELEVYHNELKNLQRIKEFKWSHLYTSLFFDVRKNAVALFMVELLQKCLKQPEENHELYSFAEDAFIHLDKSTDAVTANFPLFFAIQLSTFFGFRMEDEYSETHNILDLREGRFVSEHPDHQQYLEDPLCYITSQLLRVMQPEELTSLKLNYETRRVLLQAYEAFYALHVPDFGVIRSLPILQEVLG